MDKTNKNWLPRQRPSSDRKTKFRLIIYSHSSTNQENSVKIDPADSEITGLTGIVKISVNFRIFKNEFLEISYANKSTSINMTR